MSRLSFEQISATMFGNEPSGYLPKLVNPGGNTKLTPDFVLENLLGWNQYTVSQYVYTKHGPTTSIFESYIRQLNVRYVDIP